MSILLNVCGALIVSLQHFPDQAQREIYQQEYQCELRAQPLTTELDSPPIHRTRNIHLFFPYPNSWWPLYTLDQVNSDSINRMLDNDIKPGVIVPTKMTWRHYKDLKYVIERGAIPIIEYKQADPEYFAAKAVLATAFGVRPLAAYLPDGWDPNIFTQPSGTYFVQSNPNTLPLPARKTHYKQHVLYNTTYMDSLIVGNQAVINPPINAPLNNIQYPELNLSWNFKGIHFYSDQQKIHTNFLGYAVLITSFLYLPIDLILNTNYPLILQTLGSSISWISLLLGLGLLTLLILSIIRKVRKNGTH